MSKIKSAFRGLTVFERCLWLFSVAVISLSFLMAGGGDALTLMASLIGVTALIFVAKGYVLGQALTVAFAVLYGIISFFCRYYGEMITYLGMTAPSAVLTAVSWMRHPYEGSREVEVSRLNKQRWVLLAASTAGVTTAFYWILSALGNASIVLSTVSVATSWIASYLTFFRSPYYAVGYAANDAVLIVLWTLAARGDASYLPMVLCFAMFLLNDLYGFVNWQRMQKKQSLRTNIQSPVD